MNQACTCVIVGDERVTDPDCPIHGTPPKSRSQIATERQSAWLRSKSELPSKDNEIVWGHAGIPMNKPKPLATIRKEYPEIDAEVEALLTEERTRIKAAAVAARIDELETAKLHIGSLEPIQGYFDDRLAQLRDQARTNIEEIS